MSTHSWAIWSLIARCGNPLIDFAALPGGETLSTRMPPWGERELSTKGITASYKFSVGTTNQENRCSSDRVILPGPCLYCQPVGAYKYYWGTSLHCLLLVYSWSGWTVIAGREQTIRDNESHILISYHTDSSPRPFLCNIFWIKLSIDDCSSVLALDTTIHPWYWKQFL